MMVQLTVVHTLIISLLLGVSSYFIYVTACSLAEQIPAAGNGEMFREQLGTAVMFIIPFIIVTGGFFHYYFSKKIIRPLSQLEQSVNELKAGRYDQEIEVSTFYELEHLSRHMNELRERLQKNETTRSRMLSDMAHELRTPLSNISGYMEAMRDEVIQGDTKLYHALHQESQRLIDMVEQVQEISRWNEETSRIIAEKETLSMKDLLEEASSLFRLKFQQNNIPFHVSAESFQAFAHREGLQYAVTNLLENAYQYYEGNAPVELIGRKISSGYEILVSSSGTELSEKDQEMLFERFYRADSSRSRSRGGSGLGLSIVKNIVEQQHHGTVSIHSEHGIHTFQLRIPGAQ